MARDRDDTAVILQSPPRRAKAEVLSRDQYRPACSGDQRRAEGRLRPGGRAHDLDEGAGERRPRSARVHGELAAQRRGGAPGRPAVAPGGRGFPGEGRAPPPPPPAPPPPPPPGRA